MGTGRSCMVSFTMMIQVETKGESKLLPHPHVSGTVANCGVTIKSGQVIGWGVVYVWECHLF